MHGLKGLFAQASLSNIAASYITNSLSDCLTKTFVPTNIGMFSYIQKFRAKKNGRVGDCPNRLALPSEPLPLPLAVNNHK